MVGVQLQTVKAREILALTVVLKNLESVEAEVEREAAGRVAKRNDAAAQAGARPPVQIALENNVC